MIEVKGVFKSCETLVTNSIFMRSLFIFCIHTVELTAIPWYLMAAKYADHPVQGMLLQFVFSLVSIFAVTELLMRRKELGRKLRGGKPADKPRQRSKTRRYAAKH